MSPEQRERKREYDRANYADRMLDPAFRRREQSRFRVFRASHPEYREAENQRREAAKQAREERFWFRRRDSKGRTWSFWIVSPERMAQTVAAHGLPLEGLAYQGLTVFDERRVLLSAACPSKIWDTITHEWMHVELDAHGIDSLERHVHDAIRTSASIVTRFPKHPAPVLDLRGRGKKRFTRKEIENGCE